MISRPVRRRGLALVMALLCLTILAIVFATLSRMALSERIQGRTEERRQRAAWLAESGLERAWAKIAASADYRGETWTLPAEVLGGRDGAVVRIVVEPNSRDPAGVRVTSRADYPVDGPSRVRQTRSAFFPNKTQTKP